MFDGRFRTGVDRAVKPVGQALRRTGLSPDHLTALGLLMAVPTAWAVGSGHLAVGLILLAASAVPDLLDGALAKAAGRASSRGAFFDSVSDRVTDALVLGGVAWYLQDRHHGHAFMLPFAVLGVSLLISYERAKAESLGFDAKGGLMERAERIIVLGLGLLIPTLLVALLWVMLALTAVTAGQRFVKVWRQASAPPAPDPAPAAPPSTAATAGGDPGTSAEPDADEVLALALRWRAWREANGWVPRSARSPQGVPGAAGTRATARWHERRRRRLAGQGDDPGASLLRRPGPRRP